VEAGRSPFRSPGAKAELQPTVEGHAPGARGKLLAPVFRGQR